MSAASTSTPTTTAMPCQYCGMLHGPTCPRVSAIEYHPNGMVKRVEFYDAMGANGRREWPTGGICA